MTQTPTAVPPTRYEHLEALVAQFRRLSSADVQAVLVMLVEQKTLVSVAVQNGRVYPDVRSIPDDEFDPATVEMLFDAREGI